MPNLLHSASVVLFVASTSCAAPKPPLPCPICPAAIAPTTSAQTSAPESTAKPTEPPPRDPELQLDRVRYQDLPGWSADQHGAALPALLRSCGRIKRMPDDRPTARVAIGGLAGDWKSLCVRAAALKTSEHATARAFFEAEFVPFAARNHDDPVGRFTGYYEATLRGSLRKHGKYTVPILGRPKELITARLDDFRSDGAGNRLWGRLVGKRMRPFYTRKEINDGALAGKGLEILWVDDRVDRFFTQVQGSGRVDLDTGKRIRIGFAGKNGRKYTAIGRVLIQRGELTRETVSMQSIRAWLDANPTKVDELLHTNDGFVFFTISKRGGPRGSEGVVLTDERSMAIDRAFIPQSIPIWLDTNAPVAGEAREAPYRRLVVAQDTGGAIRGPVRGDIYFGGGDRGADLAGRMKGVGRYYLLLPLETARRLGK